MKNIRIDRLKNWISLGKWMPSIWKKQNPWNRPKQKCRQLKIPLKVTCNRLNEGEEKNTRFRRQELVKKKDILRTVRDYEKSIQQVQDKAQKNNRRLIVVNEKAGDSTKPTVSLFTEILAENFLNINKEFDI